MSSLAGIEMDPVEHQVKMYQTDGIAIPGMPRRMAMTSWSMKHSLTLAPKEHLQRRSKAHDVSPHPRPISVPGSEY
eukprot:1096863-Amphidinium_carterae.1